MSSRRLKYAKTTNLDIRPIVEGDGSFNYFFRKIVFARKKLDVIADRYVTSRKNAELRKDELMLWIRNYDVSQEDRKNGYKGNYARIFIKEVDPGDADDPDGILFAEKGYTLCVEKIDRPIHKHPQRRVVKKRHPNWGHPILRDIKNRQEKSGKPYTRFEAKEELRRLHIAYPDVSIPAADTLYIMVYSKEKELAGGSDYKPIQKIILEIKEVDEDQYKIEWRPNPVEGVLERDKINMASFSFFD